MQDLELLFDMQMSSYRELKDSDTIIVRSRNNIFLKSMPGLSGGADPLEEPLGWCRAGAPASGVGGAMGCLWRSLCVWVPGSFVGCPKALC